MLRRLKLRFERLRSDDFVRGAGVLAGGTVIGRFIGFLFLPLVTRFYSPEDYSALAFYLGLLTIFGAVSCFRFEIAIPVPAEDSKAVNLFALAILSAFFVTAALFLFSFFASSGVFGLFAPSKFEPFWYMLPVGVLFFAFYSALQYWAARRKDFRAIALTRISQSVAGGVTSSILGYFGYAPFGLLLGNVLNASAGLFRLAREFIAKDLHFLAQITPTSLYRTALEFRRYPLFSAVESLANAAGAQLPLVIIASLAVGGESGYLLLASQVMLAPMSLIGMSVSKVYLVKGAEAYRRGQLKDLTLSVQLKLIRLGVGPVILIGASAPTIFPVIFGSEWERAGVLVTYMIPWVVLQFLSSPVSSCFHLAEKQRQAMLLQIGGLFVRVGSIVFATVFIEALQTEFFIFSSAVFYFAFLLSEYSVLKFSPRDVLGLFWKSFVYILPYVLLALWVSGAL